MSIAVHERMERSRQDRDAGRMTLRRFLYENGLTLVLLALFLFSFVGQVASGLLAYNEEQREHGQATVSLTEYFTTGHFIEATAENWESEFLQMAAFVFLTAFLFQKGSPESNDPYEKEEDPPVTPDSPAAARKDGLIRKLYENSLALAFLFLFLISFALHVAGGAAQYNEEQLEHGQPTVTAMQFMASAQFWFESFQNWQSEFLSLAAMVVFAIFLRQKGSAESKPITVPHGKNE